MKSLSSDPLNLAMVIAHQLKAPVVSVATTIETLLGEYDGPLTPKQKDKLRAALSRCNDSLTTAQRLITISKALEEPDAFKAVADVSAIIRQATASYHDTALKQDIDLSSDISIDNTLIRGYEPALLEALQALIDNAIKYTPAHGHIAVKAYPGKKGRSICISVTDSGMGINEKEIDKVFKPFYRTASAKSSSRQGSGLGLAFVKAVIEAADGTISVKRSETGGAEFLITLLLAKESTDSKKGEQAMSKKLKVVIVGGVTAGPKVASKIMRLMPDAEVTIVDKGKLLSYAGCGLPYYISGVVRNQAELMSSPIGIVRDLIFFQKVKNVRTMNQTEALEIDRDNKRIKIKESLSGAESWLDYDKLVLATGASSVRSKIKGHDLGNVFSLHGPADAEGIKAELETGRARDVVIIGGGLIGIEITEALVRKGCRVTIVELREEILHILDWEMARLVEHHLESQGVRVLTNTKVKMYQGDDNVKAVVTNNRTLSTDMVILAMGVKPNVSLAQAAGLTIGETGGIKVNEHLATSDPNIFAAGDCIESIHHVTGKPCYAPLGSTANKHGRVVATNICGKDETFPSLLRSISCKVLNFNIARTGLTEREAKQEGMDIITVLSPAPDAEHFVPDAEMLMLKLIVDAKTRRLIGAQGIGPGHADKRVDVAAMAIYNNMTVDQLANMDLCYSPEHSPVMDNLITAANIARNKLDCHMHGISAMELNEKMKNKEDMIVLDVRTPKEIEYERLPNTVNIPLGVLRERISELPKNKDIVAFSSTSLRGYEAELILRAAGYKNVTTLDGGLIMWPYAKL